MRIGIVAESAAGETRVAGTPATIAQIVQLGYEVVVEIGAGSAASFPDEAYRAAGATVASREDAWAADIILKLNAPSPEEIARLRAGATIISLLAPALNPELIDALAARPITAIALDAVPRISRAQSMDVLSSMGNIAGYRAVVEAANEFGRFFTGQVTAAGKVPPAKVLVAGAGVAGLAAIGTASSLGAIVRATDPRPEVADQVKSIGGEYLPVEVAVEASSDGYAKATSEAYDRRAAELYSEQARDVDIVITTANIPGRKAPVLLTAADVASMKPGSVIVDLAAANGGNVEGTVPGERVVTPGGVIILGYTDLARRLPTQASQLYGQNLVNLLKLVTPGKDGRLVLDFEDVVQRAVTVARDGEKLWPPPAVQVSAAPAGGPSTRDSVPRSGTESNPPVPERAQRVEGRSGTAEKRRRPWLRVAFWAITGAVLLAGIAFAPDPLPQHLTVFAIAVALGFLVIGAVHHALHTPLMSVTNAISGVVVVGALIQLAVPDWTVKALAFVAVLLVAINIFGGFAVTRRMLAMFRKAER